MEIGSSIIGGGAITVGSGGILTIGGVAIVAQGVAAGAVTASSGLSIAAVAMMNFDDDFVRLNITGEDRGKKVKFNNKTVIQRDDLFDPNFVDKQGRTNIQRMKEGLAPIRSDGKSINIHHVDQTNNGPVIEMAASSHQQNYSTLHQNTGQSPSLINRVEFNKWRTQY